MPQCTARSSRTGERCRRAAIEGAAVCASHGGAAPQVKAAAEVRVAERLTALLPKVIARMEQLLDSDLDSVRLATVRDILDRLGYKPTQRLELNASMNPVEFTAWEYVSQERLEQITEWSRQIRQWMDEARALAGAAAPKLVEVAVESDREE